MRKKLQINVAKFSLRVEDWKKAFEIWSSY